MQAPLAPRTQCVLHPRTAPLGHQVSQALYIKHCEPFRLRHWFPVPGGHVAGSLLVPTRTVELLPDYVTGQHGTARPGHVPATGPCGLT